ncbi:hypothetical protein SLEP1_g52184 [Rubroshorea leprosula]|uniref:Uncharacterized protein n=1 Tax=Rubroshorea leprosula TaxID=152421 RepID=A0AAV5M763_9ROSI|nr:hypothetical protein SLEP1_g52184 [Rubroshorea leprosula]
MQIRWSICESIANSDHNGGKKRSPGVQLLVDGYIDKFRNYCPVDDVLIRS